MSRILIIEDDEAIAALEKDYLEINGYQVEITGDGEEGLSMALRSEYDLFIVDVMLPGKDGFEICREIRNKKETPLLMVSARKDDIDKIRGLGLGADDYITKPFSPGELVARVKAHLTRFDRVKQLGIAVGGPGDNIVIRNIKIDKSESRVFINGDEIKVTSKEFELLLFLAEHPNKVFSKEELFKEIWDSDFVGGIGTVAVHIKRLREKIELNPSKPQYLETIWGIGYRFKI